MLPVFAGLLLALALLPGISWGATAHRTAKLSRILAAAQREGVINFAGPSTLGPRGADALISALNKTYGLHLKLHYVPSSSYPAVVAQLVTEESTGQPPTYDVVYQTQDTIGPLFTRNLLETVDWRAILPRLSPKLILLHSKALLTDNQFMLPAYNTKLVPPQEVPKSWNDFLKPKWKGKILVPVYIGATAMYWAQLWGEEKTVEFLKKLKAQNPTLGRFAAIETRLASGEYPLAVLELNPFIEQGQEEGAPVAFVNISPTFVELDMMGVLKNSPHPNAAALFIAFTRTPEGQAIWWKYARRSSISTKGSWAEKFSRGKQLLPADIDFMMKHSRAYGREFAKALGVR